MADRYGWCAVLTLSLSGIVLETVWPFVVCKESCPLRALLSTCLYRILASGTLDTNVPIYWVWLGIVFEAVGGGITVTTTMLNLIMLNLVSDESR